MEAEAAVAPAQPRTHTQQLADLRAKVEASRQRMLDMLENEMPQAVIDSYSNVTEIKLLSSRPPLTRLVDAIFVNSYGREALGFQRVRHNSFTQPLPDLSPAPPRWP